MSATSPRRRLVPAVALATGALVLATVAALQLAPVGAGVVDGLRALGGAGAGESPPGPAPPTVPGDAQPATVHRIVDGDTIRVRVEEPGGPIAPTESIRIRLLNVDAPELDHPERGEDCGATEATAFIEALTPPGSTVHLVADAEDRDVYDRPLRGVFNEHGELVNAALVAAGWAEVVLFEPNDRFHAWLRALEDEARVAGRGAWGACAGFPP